MWFVDAWDCDPDELAPRRSDADEPQQLDCIYTNADEDGIQIPSASSVQGEELWRMFELQKAYDVLAHKRR